MPEKVVLRTFNIEGWLVSCFELDGNRLWQCECRVFQERLTRLRQGFCPHTAVAIMQHFSTQSGMF
jgi:hypothetical protein